MSLTYKRFHEMLYASDPVGSDSQVSKAQIEQLMAGLGEQWTNAVTPTNEELLSRRFELDSIDIDWIKSFVAAAEANERIDQTQINPVLKHIIEILRSANVKPDADYCSFSSLEPVAFEHIWIPVIEDELTRVQRKYAHILEKLTCDPSFLMSLGQDLLSSLSEVSIKLIYPIYNQKNSLRDLLIRHVQKQHESNPMSSRLYYAFVHEIKESGLVDLIRKYPIFGLNIVTCIENWRRNSASLIDRLFEDHANLSKLFDFGSDFRVKSVVFGSGDQHNGGQSVGIVSIIDKGVIKKIVYKPKDLQIESTYNLFLAFLNHQSQLSPLQTTKVYVGDGYGFTEYIPHVVCQSEGEVASFYKNIGRLLSTLYILGCTDCHRENIIACGTNPVLVDVETLLEGNIMEQAEGTLDLSAKYRDITMRIMDSVLQTGLLPYWDNMDKAKSPVDVSVLGDEAPKSDVEFVTGWIEANTDGMYLGSISRKAKVPPAIPVGVGGGKPFFKHIESFIKGFREQSDEIIRLKEQILSGPFRAFANLKKRVILRPTAAYFQLRELLLTPEANSNSLKQGLVLEVLARSFIDNQEHKSKYWQIFKSEVLQLGNLDIPAFYHYTDSSNIYDGSGRCVCNLDGDGLLSCFDRCEQRIRKFDQEDVEFQINLIRGVTKASGLDKTSAKHGRLPKGTHPSSITNDQLRELALKQLEQVYSIAIKTGRHEHVWLGMDLLDDGEKFRYNLLGDGLYSGVAGIVMLESTVIDDYSNRWVTHEWIARIKDVCSTRSDLDSWWSNQSLGLSGCAGVLLVLNLLGKEPSPYQTDLHFCIHRILESFSKFYLDDDFQLDVMGGSAGLIGALVNIDSLESIKIARICAQHLVDRQQQDGSWKPIKQIATPLGKPDKVFGLYGSEPGLIGFSHGVIGIISALAQLAQRTKDKTLLDSAQRGFDYMQSNYSPEFSNWPDLREQPSSAGRIFTTTWCHGSSGIILGYLCLLNTGLQLSGCESQIRSALEKWLSEPLAGTDHLCCGSLGMSVLMGLASHDSRIGSSEIRTRLSKRSKEILLQVSSESDNGVKFRTLEDFSGGIIQPGLFTGNTGIALAVESSKYSLFTLGSLLSCGLYNLSPTQLASYSSKKKGSCT